MDLGPRSLSLHVLYLFWRWKLFTQQSFLFISSSQVRVSGTAARRALFESERGICQLCFLDAHSLYQSVTVLNVRDRPAFLADTPYSSLPQQMLKKMVMDPKEGMVSVDNRLLLAASSNTFSRYRVPIRFWLWSISLAWIQSSLSNVLPLSISREATVFCLLPSRPVPSCSVSGPSPNLTATQCNQLVNNGYKLKENVARCTGPLMWPSSVSRLKLSDKIHMVKRGHDQMASWWFKITI